MKQNTIIQDYRLCLYNTMNKRAYLAILGYACNRIDTYRVDITALQILSLRGAHIEHRLHKMVGGSRITMTGCLERLLNHGYITFSMRPIRHKTPIAEVYIERKAYQITPGGRTALRKLSEYLDSKLEEVKGNVVSNRLIVS